MFGSLQELSVEIAESLQDLDAARKLEQAAQLRHARENTPETEAVYLARREEAECIYKRYRRLLVEFSRRVDTRSGDRCNREQQDSLRRGSQT